MKRSVKECDIAKRDAAVQFLAQHHAMQQVFDTHECWPCIDEQETKLPDCVKNEKPEVYRSIRTIKLETDVAVPGVGFLDAQISCCCEAKYKVGTWTKLGLFMTQQQHTQCQTTRDNEWVVPQSAEPWDRLPLKVNWVSPITEVQNAIGPAHDCRLKGDTLIYEQARITHEIYPIFSQGQNGQLQFKWNRAKLEFELDQNLRYTIAYAKRPEAETERIHLATRTFFVKTEYAPVSASQVLRFIHSVKESSLLPDCRWIVLTFFDFSNLDQQKLHAADVIWVRLGNAFQEWFHSSNASPKKARCEL
jgi:hypothetical protein